MKSHQAPTMKINVDERNEIKSELIPTTRIKGRYITAFNEVPC